VLSHGGLKLDAATRYRVTFQIKTPASNTGGLRVAFQEGTTEVSGYSIPNGPADAWQQVSFVLTTTNANPRLAFMANGLLQASIPGTSIIREGSVMNFDTSDKRYNWRNDNTGGRGVVVPDGRASSTSVDWAALAIPTASRAANTDWPLRNRQIGLAPGNR